MILFVEETFASKFIYFTFLAILSSFSKKRNVKDSWMSSILLTILPATTFVISLILRFQHVKYVTDAKTDILLIACEILMFVAIIVVFFVHERTITYQQKYMKSNCQNKSKPSTLNILISLKKDEETRIFIHDIKNNLVNISNITNDVRVKEYIKTIYDKTSEITINGKTKNKLLDVIINKYNLICKSKNITFRVLATNENLSFLNDYDLSAIFDNLLSNAVERATVENDSYINLHLECDEKFHKILIKNSCTQKPKVKNNTLLTTKSNKNIHGYGIKSIVKSLKNIMVRWSGFIMMGSSK